MAKLTDTQLMVLLEGGGARRRNSKHSRRLKQSCRSESRGKPRFSQADARGAVETCPFSIGAGCCQALSDFLYRSGGDVGRRVRASLRDRHSGPPMMG